MNKYYVKNKLISKHCEEKLSDSYKSLSLAKNSCVLGGTQKLEIAPENIEEVSQLVSDVLQMTKDCIWFFWNSCKFYELQCQDEIANNERVIALKKFYRDTETEPSEDVKKYLNYIDYFNNTRIWNMQNLTIHIKNMQYLNGVQNEIERLWAANYFLNPEVKSTLPEPNPTMNLNQDAVMKTFREMGRHQFESNAFIFSTYFPKIMELYKKRNEALERLGEIWPDTAGKMFGISMKFLNKHPSFFDKYIDMREPDFFEQFYPTYISMINERCVDEIERGIRLDKSLVLKKEDINPTCSAETLKEFISHINKATKLNQDAYLIVTAYLNNVKNNQPHRFEDERKAMLPIVKKLKEQSTIELNKDLNKHLEDLYEKHNIKEKIIDTLPSPNSKLYQEILNQPLEDVHKHITKIFINHRPLLTAKSRWFSKYDEIFLQDDCPPYFLEKDLQLPNVFCEALFKTHIQAEDVGACKLAHSRDDDYMNYMLKIYDK